MHMWGEHNFGYSQLAEKFIDQLCNKEMQTF